MAAEEKKRPALLTVESSPHVGGDLTTPRVMIDVLIALLPATLAALWLFRGYAVVLLVSCVAGAMAAGLSQQQQPVAPAGQAVQAQAGGSFCAQCGTPCAATAKFCTECGAPQQAGCPECGNTNAAGAKFCQECGGKL